MMCGSNVGVTLPDASNDPNEFGTPAFYSSIGRAFVAMCAVIPLLFGIEAIDKLTHGMLDRDGAIVPHELSGLDGIVLSPFLHANFNHLYGNAVPLLITGTFVLAGGVMRALKITALIALFAGLGVWIFSTYPTVGASGVIFGYLGFLLVRGIVERTWWTIGVAVLVGLLYWPVFGSALPTVRGEISWQAHLFGLLGGMVAALLFRSRRLRRDLPPGPTVVVPPVV
jgi:membrane associated rhomboid family serine protease